MNTWQNMLFFIAMTMVEIFTVLSFILTMARMSIPTYWRELAAVTLIQGYFHYWLWSIEPLHLYILILQLLLFMLYARFIFQMHWFSAVVLAGLCSFFYIIMQIVAVYLCDVLGIVQAEHINVRITKTTYIQQLLSASFTWLLIWICQRLKLGFTNIYGKTVFEGKPMQKWLLLGCMFIGNTISFIPLYNHLVKNKPKDMWLVVVVYAVLIVMLLVYFYRKEKERYKKQRQAYLVRNYKKIE
ncbi:hypothetical protein DUZ99_10590 [Xylanibacillus composti]|uniref:hypothetical protein n=1 Tax=Xylanibacillus composti TaxID=1572762 RepID=UPI001BCBE4A8|nr:hypothetical protein [Xylanibacillus composti]MDT9725417.1 hypothetical protein [Xylanibacillus composti]